jgi:hypothetical protein
VPLASRFLEQAPRNMQAHGLVVAAFAIAALAGATATLHSAPMIFAAAVGLLGLCLLTRRFGVGILIGALLLGGVDALPGPNLETMHVALTITGQDVVVFMLVVLLVWVNRGPAMLRFLGTTAGKAITVWSVAFLLLWAFVAIRTTFTAPVPLSKSLFTGRPYAYLALLTPLLVQPLRDPACRRAVFASCGVGALVTSLALTAASLHAGSLSLLVHSTDTSVNAGLVRIYTGATALPIAALPMALGAVLFGRGTRIRIYGGAVAVTSGAAIALSLTRALYVAELVGIGLALVVWLALADSLGRFGRRQLIRVGLVVAVGAFALWLYRPSGQVSTALAGISQRATTVLTGQAQNSANTLTVRDTESSDLRYALGQHWVVGLGFLDASYVYLPQVVGGSIQNTDVGYLNIVMTMGVVGAALYYAPVILIALALLWSRVRGTYDPELAPVNFGLLAFLIAVLLSSVTLVILFSDTGVVPAAAAMALALAVLERPEGTPEAASHTPLPMRASGRGWRGPVLPQNGRAPRRRALTRFGRQG